MLDWMSLCSVQVYPEARTLIYFNNIPIKLISGYRKGLIFDTFFHGAGKQRFKLLCNLYQVLRIVLNIGFHTLGMCSRISTERTGEKQAEVAAQGSFRAMNCASQGQGVVTSSLLLPTLTSVVLCGMQTTVDNDDSYMSL
jgi:hypothetical protein